MSAIKVALPLKEMSLMQKMDVMEEIWKDLSCSVAEYSPPDWHGSILAERKRLAESGEVGFSDWETAKQEIQNRIR